MICSNLHEDMENPPDIPAFSGSVPKKPQKESVTDVLAGAALAFAKAFTSEKANQWEYVCVSAFSNWWSLSWQSNRAKNEEF